MSVSILIEVVVVVVVVVIVVVPWNFLMRLLRIVIEVTGIHRMLSLATTVITSISLVSSTTVDIFPGRISLMSSM